MAMPWEADPIVQPAAPLIGQTDAYGNPVNLGGATTRDPTTGKLRISFQPESVAPAQSAQKAPWESDPIVQPSSSVGGSAVRGALQGLTFGTSDEMAGVAAASPKGVHDTIGQVPVLGNVADFLAGGVNLLAGGSGAQGRYDQAVTEQRDQLAADQEQHPIASIAGGLGGALATMPLTAPLNLFRGAGVAARIGNALIQGMAGGAAYGAGTAEGDPGQRAQGAAQGAGVGAGLGLAGSVAGKVVGSVAAPLQKFVTQEGAANRAVQTAFARDKVPVGQAASVLSAAKRTGTPMVVADTGGENVRALARSAANISPEGRAALDQTTQGRYQTQADRAATFIRKISGGANSTATQDQLKAAAQRVNRPAYERAYRQGSGGIWNANLQQLTTAPDMQAAIGSSTRTGANKAAVGGYSPPNNPFVKNAAGSLGLRVDKNGTRAIPSLQFWDHVKQNLDDMVSRAQRAGDSGHARDLIAIKNQLVSELDSAVPAYANARAGAAAFFGAQDALEAGGNFVQRGDIDGAKKALAKFSAPEKQLFAEGFASEMIRMVREASDRGDIVHSVLWNSPAARERIALAIGPKAAKALDSFISLEGTMSKLKTALGNSTTARQLMEIGLAGGAGFAIAGGSVYDPKAWLVALMTAGLAKGRQKVVLGVNRNVASKVAEMLTSDNPQVLMNGLNTISNSPRLTAVVRSVNEYVTRLTANSGQAVAGQQQNQ